MTKQCRDCKQDKPVDEFYRCKVGSMGRASYCKPCHNLRGKKARGTDTLVKEVLPEGMRRCGRCKEAKNHTEFYRHGPEIQHVSKRNKLRTQCKLCDNHLARRWQTSPGGERKVRNAGFIRRLGITLEEYETMLVAQNYLCCICEIDLRTTKADTDHCHATGNIRGILCHNCNLAIGLFKDNPSFCASAGKYLTAHIATQ